ncbi:rhodanese-like domain-containing protein [Massilia sp. W12]|uniref:rhodanese-like domain-containing protein n=1 Tax=Massilia sp. W12 TaxID=3126507 RepID=UPI0030CF686F
MMMRVLILVLASYCMQAQAQAQAQAQSTAAPAASAAAQTLPPILQQLPRASGQCPKEQAAPGELLAPQRKADLSCQLSAAALQRLMLTDSAKLLLADVRQEAEYRDWHINSALHLSEQELLRKPYWRNHTVVLLGNGKSARELYEVCAAVKQQGYAKVHVLHGGMPFWLMHAAKQSLPAPFQLVGRVPAVGGMLRINAAELWVEAQNHDNLVLYAPEQAGMAQDVPQALPLKQLSPAALKAALEKRRKEAPHAPPLSALLVLAPSGLSDKQIEELQQAAAMPILLYEQGRDAWQANLVRQKQIWQAQARGPKLPGCPG